MNRIEVNPRVMLRKPVIRGTRILVELIGSARGRVLVSLIVAVGLSAPSSAQPDSGAWADRSAHTDHFVTVNGIKLHYLDWGGSGPTLLFLHGLGDTPHCFDDLAPHFLDRHRVLGLTRRGHGQSDRPKSGYDTATLGRDIVALLDAMRIDNAILAGHSMAGDELTWVAAHYPARVRKLVYLDAAYNRNTQPDLDQFYDTPKESLASLDAYRELQKSFVHGAWSRAMEANMRASVCIHADGTVEELVSGELAKTLIKEMRGSNQDYAHVRLPALSFYALIDKAPPAPASAKGKEKEFQAGMQEVKRWQQAQITVLKSSGSHVQIIEMPGATHYCFIDRQEQVVRAMKEFLAGR
jgi:pimeloyl-ACP methyl ester carboxylesterase